jgi:hypothetical protein
MAETFLEEQLKRIRKMSEQMSRLHDSAVGLGQSRTHGSDEVRGHPHNQDAPLRRHTSRHSSRRRGR